MQVLGYSIALGGIQIYGIVSREPSRFQGTDDVGPNGLGVEGVEDVRTEVCWLPEGRLDGLNIHTGTNSSDEIPSEYPESENKITVHRTHRTRNSTERDAVYLRKLEPFIIQAADLFHDIMADSRSLGLHFQVVFSFFSETWGPMVENLCSTMSHPLAPDSGLVRGLWQHIRNPAAHMVAPEGVGMEAWHIKFGE